MNRKEQALVGFVVALAVGYVAQNIAKNEAAILGLTALEVAVIGLALPVLAKRLA